MYVRTSLAELMYIIIYVTVHILEFINISNTANILEQGDNTSSRIVINIGFPTFNIQDQPHTFAYVSVIILSMSRQVV